MSDHVLNRNPAPLKTMTLSITQPIPTCPNLFIRNHSQSLRTSTTPIPPTALEASHLHAEHRYPTNQVQSIAAVLGTVVAVLTAARHPNTQQVLYRSATNYCSRKHLIPLRVLYPYSTLQSIQYNFPVTSRARTVSLIGHE